jgi:hypothetical protein
VKPAGTLGFGPSTVRGYDEPARRTGRVLPSPDSTLQFLTQRVGHTIGHRLSSQIRDRIHKRFDSASSRFVSGDCPLTVRLLDTISDTVA